MKNIFYKSLILLLFASSAMAQNANDEVSFRVAKFVDDIGNKIVKIAGEQKTSETIKKQKIINEIDKVIDSDWIARFVLGKNYKTATDQQKQRFMALYRSFMINTYGPKFKNYNGRKFTVLTVEKQSSFYVAKCEFLPRNSNTAISVDFRVKDRDGQLVILDFVAEGISLIETQRSEFNSAISQKGMDGFMDDFSKRVDELKNQK